MSVAVVLALALAAMQAPVAPSAPDPVTAQEELAAAVRTPQPGTPESTAPGLRRHEERITERLAPDNPSNVAAWRRTGPGCGQDGGALRCETNQEVSSQSSPATARDQTPDTDLMGRPR